MSLTLGLIMVLLLWGSVHGGGTPPILRQPGSQPRGLPVKFEPEGAKAEGCLHNPKTAFERNGTKNDASKIGDAVSELLRARDDLWAQWSASLITAYSDGLQGQDKLAKLCIQMMDEISYGMRRCLAAKGDASEVDRRLFVLQTAISESRRILATRRAHGLKAFRSVRTRLANLEISHQDNLDRNRQLILAALEHDQS